VFTCRFRLFLLLRPLGNQATQKEKRETYRSGIMIQMSRWLGRGTWPEGGWETGDLSAIFFSGSRCACEFARYEMRVASSMSSLHMSTRAKYNMVLLWHEVLYYAHKAHGHHGTGGVK
jgi:hypothetical protein